MTSKTNFNNKKEIKMATNNNNSKKSARKTKIEWTLHTWNPITGCTKTSEGCKYCYAEEFSKRLLAMGQKKYKNLFNLTIHYDLFDEPLTNKKPDLIFVNSMSDLFHKDVPDEVILRLFETMNKANWHTFQILTKRADRLEKLSSQINWTPNIWMGVSVENSDVASRIDHLKKTGAAVKFISAEPLLGSLANIDLNGIDWLIVGGESGTHARPMQKQWVIELRDLATKTDTPFFFKQWGGKNKKAAGSLLEGKEYKAFPKCYKL